MTLKVNFAVPCLWCNVGDFDE